MNTTLKTLTSLALLAGTAQLAHAHAGFKDQILEGTAKTWNAVAITHGCNTNIGGEGSNVPHKDVIAISAIFPNSPNFSDVIIRGSKGKPAAAAVLNTDGSVKTPAVEGFTSGEETIIPNLANDIVGSTADTTPLKAALSVVTSGGTLFANTIPVVDAKGNVRGWQGWTGSPFNSPSLLESAKKADGSDISTTGLSPFGINGFQFQPTSCAKTLKIRVAVANWCEKGAKSFKSPSRVDLWIGHMTTKFNDPEVMPNAGANPVFWSTLTVNRDLVKNPITKACDQPTDYDTVYIEPSNADIDNFLPISAAKYPAGANGALFWPTAK